MNGQTVAPTRVALLGLIAVLCLWLNPGTPAHGASPFYEGKTIKIVVGVSPGGGFDTFARLLARHLPLHMPGKPRIIVQNLPGAGSLIAANRVYAEQPGDGLTIVNFAAGVVLQALMEDPAAKFESREVHVVG